MLKPLSSAAFVLAALTVQQAQAGVPPPVISGFYYEQNGSAQCGPGASGSSSSGGGSNVSTCQILFAAPPAGKELYLTEVSCSVQSIGFEIRDMYAALNVNGAVKRQRYLKPVLVGQNGASVRYYASNDQLNGYLVNAPPRIVVDNVSAGTFYMDCQISGTLQSPSAP